MALSKQRLGEIALAALMAKMEKDGVHVKPGEIKREVANAAKQLGADAREVAELFRIVLDDIFSKVIAELDIMILDGRNDTNTFIPPSQPRKMVKPDPAVGPTFTPPSSDEKKE